MIEQFVIDPPWPQRRGGIGHRNTRPFQRGHEFPYRTMTIPAIFELLDREILTRAAPIHNVFVWGIDKFLHAGDGAMLERGYRLHCRFVWDKRNGPAPAFTIRYAHEYLSWFYKPRLLKVDRRQPQEVLDGHPRGAARAQPEAGRRIRARSETLPDVGAPRRFQPGAETGLGAVRRRDRLFSPLDLRPIGPYDSITAPTREERMAPSNIDRVIAAIRTIHKHHNLGDAAYAVRDHAAGLMKDGDGTAWQHPFVTEYSAAVQALHEEGVIGDEQEIDRTQPRTVVLQGGPKHGEFTTLQPNTRELEILANRRTARGDGSKVAVVEGKYVETPDVRIFCWRAEP